MSPALSLEETIVEITQNARKASRSLLSLSTASKNNILKQMAKMLDEKRTFIQQENQKDLRSGSEKGLSPAMLDRLKLSDKVIDSMINGLKEVVDLPNPVGEVTELSKRPNNLMVGRMRIPLGVIGMIYESRPNVTVDAAALCLKTGNAIILRGGSEAIHSNMALAEVLQEAMAIEKVNSYAIQVIPVTDREAVDILLQQEEYIDLIIPRGGEGLIRFVAENSRIPVLKHYKGVCNIFIDEFADFDKAVPIVLNSKTQRPGVCNALEGLLVHQNIAQSFLPRIVTELQDAGVKVLACEKSVELIPELEKAQKQDWGTEFLDLRLCLKIVTGFEDAQDYIAQYGSLHTESIVTENYSTAQRFIRETDASAVMVNASTRFNDGGELGFGTEIGISTTKLHAYGPMGLKELTTKKFIIYGEGQIRQ